MFRTYLEVAIVRRKLWSLGELSRQGVDKVGHQAGRCVVRLASVEYRCKYYININIHIRHKRNIDTNINIRAHLAEVVANQLSSQLGQAVPCSSTSFPTKAAALHQGEHKAGLSRTRATS